MFIGRNLELSLLDKQFNHLKSNIVILYGRRRIGKSQLIHEFAKNINSLQFEAIEHGKTIAQIKHFTNQLKKQIDNPLLQMASFTSWEEIFDYLTDYLRAQNKKTVLFFDEFQWMAAKQGKLVSLIKYYWDNHWKDTNCLLILCGSVASYMVEKVIKSKALYGRSSLEINLESLSPQESWLLLKKKRSKEEVLQYLMLLGGVPKYLEEINLKLSFKQNINHLFFNKNSLFKDEFEKIFYSQFKEPKRYKKIIQIIKDRPLTLSEIGKKLKVSAGGSLKSYLTNLQLCGFIQSFVSLDKKDNSRFRKYKLTDPYLVFYCKYIEPNLDIISKNTSKNLFKSLVELHLRPWLGIAFENFCLKHQEYLATIMGFNDKVIAVGPYYGTGDSKFQIDLLYKRADQVITICEIKYHNKPLTSLVIAEVEKKIKLLKIPRGYTLEKALICVYGVNEATEYSNYFDHIITLEDLF